MNIRKPQKSNEAAPFRNAVLSIRRRVLTILLVLTVFAQSTTFVSGGAFAKNINTRFEELSVIESGKPVQARLAGGDSHLYNVALKANQFVDFKLTEKGIDLAVSLIDPDNQKTVNADNVNYSGDTEHLPVIAQRSGNYIIEVKALNTVAVSGEYTLVFES